MDGKIVNKIFKETQRECSRYLKEDYRDEDNESFEEISAEVMDCSMMFTMKFIMKLFNSDDFKYELFKDMMEQKSKLMQENDQGLKMIEKRRRSW